MQLVSAVAVRAQTVWQLWGVVGVCSTPPHLLASSRNSQPTPAVRPPRRPALSAAAERITLSWARARALMLSLGGGGAGE